MKSSWYSKPLEEVCDITNGLWKGKDGPLIKVGVIRNTNFTKEGNLDDSEITFLDVEERQFRNRRLQYGDIILEKSGGGPKQPVGRVILFDKQEGLFSFSNFTSAIRVKNSAELSFRFLHLLLFWKHLSGATEKMQNHSTGIRNLDNKAYKSMTISYPPLPEQKRIVAILDEAFAGIAVARANSERNLKNAKAVFEYALEQVLSVQDEEYKEMTIGNSCDLFQGLCINTKSKHLLAKSGIPLLRIKDLRG